jgi:HlyD family secretion protein
VNPRRLPTLRALGLALLAVLLVGALAFVALRTGPLAPTRVTVTRAATGTLQPMLLAWLARR